MKLAVVGISCQFGSCLNKEEVWDVLKRKESCIREIPQNRKEKLTKIYGKQNYFKASFIENIDSLDIDFFNISPKEAKLMDPKQKILLKEAWKAFYDAGYNENELNGKNLGVFVGVDNSVDKEFSYLSTSDDSSFMNTSGNLSGMLSGRISHYFNLKGPSLVVDTECSSGLVALNEACNSIKFSQCDAALVAGINIFNNPIELQKVVNIQSKDYKIHPFSDWANGTVWGEGVGCLVIVPYELAKKNNMHVYGFIDGVGVNNDGKTNGIGVPDINSQKMVIQMAMKNAEICPDDVYYIETHGTGTKIGDPVEFEGLERAFRNRKTKEKCGLGTVKTNFGHTVGAAGIISLIKLMLAFDKKEIPGNIPTSSINKYIDLINSPFYMADYDIQLQNNKKYYCGISSFGLSGTNAHVIVSNCIQKEKAYFRTNPYVFKMSFKTESGLMKQCKKIAEFIENYAPQLNINDFCYSVNRRFNGYKYYIVHEFSKLKDLYTWLINLADNEIHKNNVNLLAGKGNLINIPFDGFVEEDCWNNESKIINNTFKINNHLKQDIKKGQTVSQFIYYFFKKELGFDNIDFNKPLVELGIDSIVATKFINELNVKFKLDVKLTDLFSGKNINDIIRNAKQKDSFLEANKVSRNQEQIYIADKYNENTSYNINFSIKFDTKINNERLIKCIKNIYNNVRILRCNFYEKDGLLYASENKKDLIVEREQTITRFKQSDVKVKMEQFNTKLNVNDDQLCKFKLIEYKDCTVLVCLFHHIIFDGYSAILFSNLLIKMYKNMNYKIPSNDYFLNNTEKKVIYKKYDMNLESYCGSIIEVENSLGNDNSNAIYEPFDESLVSQIDDFCKSNNINKNNFYLAVLFVLMNYYTGKSNLKIDCVVSGRFTQGSQQIIGPYSYSTTIGVNLNPKKNFVQNLQVISNKVYENLKPNNPKQTHSKILFTTQEIGENVLNKSLSIIPYNSDDAKVPLELQVYSGKVNGISIQYKRQYTSQFINRLALNYKNVILSIIKDSKKTINQLNVLSSYERDTLNDFQVGRY